MPIIPVLPDLQNGDIIDADQLDQIHAAIRDVVNTYAVLTDVARTLTVAPSFAHADGLYTDTISERTAAVGVSIDGVLLQDGGISLAGTLEGILADFDDVAVADALTVGGAATFAGAVSVAAAQRLYLDGGGDTYIWENTANEVQVVAGSAAIAAFNSSGVRATVTNTRALGTSAIRWSNVYSVLGNFSGAVTMSSTLAVTGAVTGGTYNGQTISATASFTGTVTVAGAVTLNSTLTVAGAATFNDGINVAALERIYLDGGGDTYIHEAASNSLRLVVGGATSLTLSATGASFIGAVVIPGTLAVTGAATFTATPQMDAIAERTPGAGVTVDGLLIKDGAIAQAGVTGLTAALAAKADLSGAAFTGAVTMASTLSVTGGLTMSADSASIIQIGATNRAQIGALAAASSGQDMVFRTGNSVSGTAERVRITSTGIVLIGTTVSTGAAAGEIVIPNSSYIRAIVGAGTSAMAMIGVDGSNVVRLGPSGNHTAINAASRFYLDGGSDTYLYEEVANQITVIAGGSARMTFNQSGSNRSHTHLYPGTTETYYCGSAGLRWAGIYSLGGDFSGAVNIAGTLTLSDHILKNVGNSSLAVSGGTATNSGGNLQFYGATHATLANQVHVRAAGTTVATFASGAVAVTGTVTVSSTVTANDFIKSSHRSLKRNIKSLSLDTALRLLEAPVRTWEWISGGEGWGHVTDELDSAFVTAELRGVSESRISAAHTRILQELWQRVGMLEAKLAAQAA